MNSLNAFSPGDNTPPRGQTPPGSRQSPLIVLVDGHCHEIHPADLLDDLSATSLRAQFRGTSQTIVFVLVHLLDWDDEQRQAVLIFVAEFGDRCEVRAQREALAVGNLFDTVLTFMVGAADIARFERGRKAAIEVAALVHPGALTPACNRILERLQELAVRGYRVDRLTAEAQAFVDAYNMSESVETSVMLVTECLPGAPVPENAIVPPGWLLGAAGVTRSGRESSPEAVISAPLIIKCRFIDIRNEAEFVEIAWYRDGQWRTKRVERHQIANTRQVVQLAAFGVPVTSNNERKLVQYLADFEAYNIDILPRSHVTQQLGWQHEGIETAFLCGRQFIAASNDRPVIFQGADDGQEQLVDGYQSSGTLQGWLNSLVPVGGCIRVQVAIYTALCACLMRILHAPNFVVSYAGATSTGKTTTCRVAGSVWGNPDEHCPAAVLGTWDATRVWAEQAMAIGNDLPFVLDDTQRARNEEVIAQLIYDVTSGRGRGRGSITGIRESSTWRTVMITSGERPITSFGEHGGVYARVLEFWGSPFGRPTDRSAHMVGAVNDGILENFGHAGPAFVRHLIERQQHWGALREEYNAQSRLLQERANGNNVAGRLGQSLAALVITARIAHECLSLPWYCPNLVDELWDELTIRFEEADRAAAALQYVLSWAHSNPNLFYGRRPTSNGDPFGGWAGKWGGETPGTACDFLGLFPQKLDEVLVAGGFSPEATQNLWKDRGWLLRDNGSGKWRRRVRIQDRQPWLVAISNHVIEEVDGPLEEPVSIGNRPARFSAGARPPLMGEQGTEGGTVGGTP